MADETKNKIDKNVEEEIKKDFSSIGETLKQTLSDSTSLEVPNVEFNELTPIENKIDELSSTIIKDSKNESKESLKTEKTLEKIDKTFQNNEKSSNTDKTFQSTNKTNTTNTSNTTNTTNTRNESVLLDSSSMDKIKANFLAIGASFKKTFQDSVKGQSSSLKETLKKPFKTIKSNLKPGSIVRNAGLLSNSPLIATMGDKINELTDTTIKNFKEAKKDKETVNKESTSVNKETATLVNKESAKDSTILNLIAKNTSTLVGDTSDYEKLTKEVVQNTEPVEDFNREQADEKKLSLQEKMNKMLSGMSDSLKKMSKGFKELKDKMGNGFLQALGIGASLIAIPLMTLFGFFQGLFDSVKLIEKFTKKNVLSKAVEEIKSLVQTIKESKFIKSFSKVGEYIGKLFEAVKTALGPKKLGFISKLFSGFKAFGEVLGKLALPVTIIWGAYETIKGFIKGFQEGGFIEGLKQGIFSLFDFLIGGIVDLIVDIGVWILEKLGFDGAAEYVTNLYASIKNLLGNIFGGYIDAIGAVWGFVKDVFTGKGLIDSGKELADKLGNIFNGIKDAISGYLTSLLPDWLLKKMGLKTSEELDAEKRMNELDTKYKKQEKWLKDAETSSITKDGQVLVGKEKEQYIAKEKEKLNIIVKEYGKNEEIVFEGKQRRGELDQAANLKDSSLIAKDVKPLSYNEMQKGSISNIPSNRSESTNNLVQNTTNNIASAPDMSTISDDRSLYANIGVSP